MLNKRLHQSVLALCMTFTLVSTRLQAEEESEEPPLNTELYNTDHGSDGMGVSTTIHTKSYDTYGGWYPFLVDKKMSPYSGGRNIISSLNLIAGYRMNEFTPGSWTSRLLSSVMLWYPVDAIAMSVARNTFGKEYRIRDFGSESAKRLNSNFKLFGPNRTTYRIYTDNFNSYKFAAVSIAGSEAGNIYLDMMRFDALQNHQKLNGRLAYSYTSVVRMNNFFLKSRGSYSLDVILSSDKHDVSDYIYAFNATYPDTHITFDDIASQAWVNLLDPFLYYNLYAAVNYIIYGQPVQFPMIRLSEEVSYLPAVRFSLTPFTPQYTLQNFFLYKKKLIYGYLGYGTKGSNQAISAGIRIPNVYEFTDSFFVGGNVDIWYQPSFIFDRGSRLIPLYPGSQVDTLSVGYNKEQQNKSIVGVGGYIRAEKRFFDMFGLLAEIGGKTRGYLPGESLSACLNGRIGFSIKY